MIIWRTDKLAEQLVNTRLTERQKVSYYLAVIYLQLLSSAIPAYFWGSKTDELGLVSYLLGAIVATYSILKIFKINKGIDGKNIIERLIILSFPAFVKATIFYWVLYVVFIIIYAITDNMLIYRVFGFLILPLYYLFALEQIAISLKKQCITSR